ncbi:MAG: flagellar hook-length control protein FliK, partial [Aeromonas sp.]
VMGDSVAQVITGLQPASTAHSNVQSMLSQLTPVPGDRSGAPVITAAAPAVTQAEPQAQSAEVEGLTSPLAVTPSGEQHNADELALTSLVGGNRLTTVASAGTQATPQAQSAELISEVEGLTSPLAVTPSGEQHKADELAPAPQAGEEEQGLLAIPSAKEREQIQTLQAGQSSQQQLGDNRLSGVEGTVRREPQQLPHLKLAGQDAPAELYQKVNLMLADKLQQVEIQLDPLGLGKMKIQIQIGADSQANVHFVVQHGQTREMLEQAMPRLRDMLAGQGIQLGQAQVEQQTQQQQQGKPSFNGQGQSGQGGSQAHAGSSSGEGDITTSTLSVLVESTNSSGIDFYA